MLNRETWQFVREHQNDDVRKLALRSNKNPQVDLSSALIQIAGRQTAKEKIPSWYKAENIVYPKHLSLEQCSSETTAVYKASLAEGKERLVDLTGGFGIDCAFMSAKFRQTTYVEQQKELCLLAENNFSSLGLSNITIVCGNGKDFLEQMEKVDCIYIDPARRNEHGNKIVSISDCEPDVKNLSALLIEKADQVIIKLSPMLDISQALSDMPMTKELHIVSVDNECKELLLVLGRTKHPVDIPVHCVNLKKKSEQKFTFNYRQEQEAVCRYISTPQKYIYEPNSSVLKAGAFKVLSQMYDIHKFHPNSHLYTSDVLVNEFPGRIFAYETMFSLNKKELQSQFKEIKKANLAVRNFPVSVAELRKRLKLAEGGNIYLFATTLENGDKVIIRCSKIAEDVKE